MITLKKNCNLDHYQSIVDLFVMSFDENSRLSQYMYDLGEELVKITKEIESNKAQIKKFHETRGMTEASKQERIKNLKQDANVLSSNKKNYEQSNSEMREKIMSLATSVSEIQSTLNLIGLTNQKNPEFVLDFENLNEIEECVSILQFIVKQKNKDQDEISAYNQRSKSPYTKVVVLDTDSILEPEEVYYPLSAIEIRHRALKSLEILKNNKYYYA